MRFEWESQLEANLYSIISSVSLDREVKDIKEWGSEDSGLFSVKLAYDMLVNHANGQHNEVFTYLWKVKELPKVVTTA